jgi:hypothetical protein
MQNSKLPAFGSGGMQRDSKQWWLLAGITFVMVRECKKYPAGRDFKVLSQLGITQIVWQRSEQPGGPECIVLSRYSKSENVQAC